MYEGMCFSAFYKLYRDLTVSSAAERVLCCLETFTLRDFSTSETQCFLQTLEAPADFTTLVPSIK